MDWSNERYIRLYTRDTDDWLALTWQGRALFPLILRKVDRAGVLETKRGPVGVAALTGLPREVVEVGLPDLLNDGCVTECDRGYVIRNFIEAQEAVQSDAQRQRESRGKRRARALESRQAVTPRDDMESQSVTKCHAQSHGVTRGHARSLQPSLAKPSQTSQEQELLPAPSRNVTGGGKAKSDGGWPGRLHERWLLRIGDVSIGHLGAKLKGVVDRFGEPAVLAAVDEYAAADRKGRPKTPTEFAANFQHWHTEAEKPAVLPGGILPEYAPPHS